jgi:hypothetical protein
LAEDLTDGEESPVNGVLCPYTADGWDRVDRGVCTSVPVFGFGCTALGAPSVFSG